MIELTFITGGAIRKVVIQDRNISLLSAELGFMPFTIDLDKIDDENNKKKIKEMKLSEEEEEEMKELAKLGTEEEIAKDITKDFQAKGWRMVKRI